MLPRLPAGSVKEPGGSALGSSILLRLLVGLVTERGSAAMAPETPRKEIAALASPSGMTYYDGNHAHLPLPPGP